LKQRGSFAFIYGFLPLQLETHTLQGVAHIPKLLEQQSSAATIGRMANSMQAIKKDVSRLSLASQKGRSTLQLFPPFLAKDECIKA